MTECGRRSGCPSWCGVASYFDGDGNVDIELAKLTLRFRLAWTDNWRPQLDQLRVFLEVHGVRTERIVYGNGAYHLPVGGISSLATAARRMLESGRAYKKKRELEAMLGYFEDRLTGNQAAKEFNECVRLVSEVVSQEYLVTL